MTVRIVVPMHWVKETKNTNRYEADAMPPKGSLDPKPPVDCIYLQKAAVNGLTPRKVNVEVVYE